MSLRFASRALIPALVLAAACRPEARAAEAYALGPADKLRVTVYQWAQGPVPAQGGDFQARLDGQFTIDNAGNLPLPLVGEVPAEGRATTELARAISEMFQAKLGTLTMPSASVEIVEYRPFYVIGVVDQPGSYPFRPGMTVLHAVSIAGGLYRRPEDPSRYQREALTAAGDGALQAASRDLLLVRAARLEAELAGHEAIAFPDEILARRTEPTIARTMADEAKIMKQRGIALDAAVASQRNLKALAERQNGALEAQTAAIDRQMAIAKRELEDQTDLVSKGLSRRPVLFPIEARHAEAEAKKRQLHSDILKNAQDIARAEQTAEELRTNRRIEILDQLKEARANLEQARQKIVTDQRIVDHSDGEFRVRTGEAVPTYAILRRDGDRMRERGVPETARVEPGDVVRVVLPPRRAPGAPGAISEPGPTAALARETHLTDARP
ncbi:polysaccharide biosynthesis/export family protein [Methylobacterium sp. J-068]|uniref:polysaccharide biosynthesis/export family protein n=1 Tax=Methylobacterium sp. J-068 TaxID=2836649 RepID=UPI001FBA2211|nr:polysaccharide biosynthesis/export family protein [Methylobacterium sp. J-068]MCJ2034856.1 polysaccharide export protein [Methylobacterium sp. J-068]